MSEKRMEPGGTPQPRFKPYPAYRDSGVEWLGEIPAHWEVVPNSALFRERDQRGRTDLPILEVSIASGVRVREFSDTKIEQRSDDLGAYKVAAAGDMAFNKMRMWQGAVGVAPECGLVSPDYIVAEPRTGVESAYYSSVFRAPLYMAEVYRWSHGIVDDRNRLYWDDFKAIRSPSPPSHEQRAIIGFVDRETAKLDALVAKKERVIELLEEKRTGLITRAVTKGLDLSAPMKDSGVEWLGEIPAHWKVERIRHIVRRIEQGWSPECENREAQEDEWGVLKAGCVNHGLFLESEHKALPSDLQPIPGLEIAAGDLLMSRASGSRELVGSVAIVPTCRRRLLLCDKVFRLHVKTERADRRFLALAMNSRVARWQIEVALSGGSGLANNIAQQVVKGLIVALPARSEQGAIVDFLDRETARVDALAARIRDAIDRLKEFRAALISAAVTGKIDVRDGLDAEGFQA